MLGIKEMLLKSEKSTIELANKTVVGSAGGDMVVVEANGAFEILSSQNRKGKLLAGDDHELLEDLVAVVVNHALTKARDTVTEEVTKITGGLRIPGLF